MTVHKVKGDPLSELRYSYACPAETYVFVTVAYYIGDSAEILADKLAEYAVALAVEYAHLLHSDKDCIVYEILHRHKCLVAAHPADIQLMVEIA